MKPKTYCRNCLRIRAIKDRSCSSCGASLTNIVDDIQRSVRRSILSSKNAALRNRADDGTFREGPNQEKA
jgi:hypothetical protein